MQINSKDDQTDLKYSMNTIQKIRQIYKLELKRYQYVEKEKCDMRIIIAQTINKIEVGNNIMVEFSQL